VPEAWFFRGGGLFEALARRVAALPPARPFRALSLPCGSGEEPYSLAMALLEAGVPPGRWTTEGVDISARVVEAARRGVYRELSFRQTAPGLRDRYFRPVPGGWELSPGVRGRAHFRVGNVVDPGLLPDGSGAFDLVL